MIAHGKVASRELDLRVADSRSVRTVHADAEWSLFRQVRSMKSAQPFFRARISSPPRLVAGQITGTGRLFVGKPGREPVVTPPEKSAHAHRTTIPLPFVDHLLDGKDSDQRERQHSEWIQAEDRRRSVTWLVGAENRWDHVASRTLLNGFLRRVAVHQGKRD